jgi:hypothetical protein
MKLRCRVCKIILLYNKLGNKARNVNKPGALHTPSLRLDFFAPRFVSRQKSGRRKNETLLNCSYAKTICRVLNFYESSS